MLLKRGRSAVEKEKPAERELLTAGVGGADTLDAVVNTSILTQKEKSPNANRVRTQSVRGGHFRCHPFT